MSEDEPFSEERRTAPISARRGPREADADLPRPGAVVDGKYRIERVLGAGGMGVVMSAMHLELGDRVALKFVKVAAGEAEVVERLRREARITFRLRGPHVARLLDFGSLPSGAPFLVLEHLEGEDLSRALAARGAFPVAEAVGCVLQACTALAEAHGLGVVHRDLKPSNLFLTRSADGAPLVKVLDFGVAKALEPRGDGAVATGADGLTTTGTVVGTPLYMSPEQVRGAKHVDARSDVWALGVILHELVTGQPPFPRGPASAVCAAIAADPPQRLRDGCPGAPVELERIVARCLEKDPAKRFDTVGELAEALAPLGPGGAARRHVLREGQISAAGATFDVAPHVGAALATPRARVLVVRAAGIALAAGLVVLSIARVRRAELGSDASAGAPLASSFANTTPAPTASASGAAPPDEAHHAHDVAAPAPAPAPPEVAAPPRAEPAPSSLPRRTLERVPSAATSTPSPAPRGTAPAKPSAAPSPPTPLDPAELELRAMSRRR